MGVSLRTLALAGLALASGSVPAAAAPPDARVLAVHCHTCHGVAGDEAMIPALEGRDQDDLLERLRAFRDGGTDATVMTRIARGYSDDELALIAAWFAAAPAMKAPR